MSSFVTAGAGFLVAVLWFDLMHDVQVLRTSDDELPKAILGSIAGYYRRVTTDAFPMNRLVALVMLSTLGALVAQLTVGSAPQWISGTGLGLVAAATTLAVARTVPSAKRLAQQSDTVRVQSRLARTIFTDHLMCLGAVLTALSLELAFGR